MTDLIDLNATRLRTYMSLTGVTSISDDQLDMAIEDATNFTSSFTDDEIAVRYYSAFLLAKSVDWNTLQKTGEVSFFRPNPQTYKKLYNERLSELGLTPGLACSEGDLPGIMS